MRNREWEVKKEGFNWFQLNQGRRETWILKGIPQLNPQMSNLT